MSRGDIPRAGGDQQREPSGRGSSAPSRHFRSKHGSPLWLKIVALSLAVILAGGIVFATVQLLRLQSNLTTAPLNLGTEEGTELPVDRNTDPLQILILGTDTRIGNAGYGPTELSEGRGNSDVMMLMHLSADRERVTVVSFPRDLMVSLPACEDPQTGEVYPPQEVAQLNTALSYGGPGCTVAAINQLTGLTIDHFMMADFNAVKEMSTTLGGVEVCLNQAIFDDDSNLDLPAGVSTIEGEQALAFLRTRHGFGDGGDLGRIRAQQSFLSSMVRKIKDNDTLSNIPKLYAIAETITRNLTVDEGLSEIRTLVGMADRLQGVDLGNVSFVTVPNESWSRGADSGRRQLEQPAAEELFTTLQRDRDITGDEEPTAAESDDPDVGATTSGAPTGPATEPPSSAAAEDTAPAIDPAIIPLEVVNASGSDGRVQELLTALIEAGYTQAVSGGDVPDLPGTQVFYGGSGYRAMAEQVAAELGIPAAQVVPSASIFGVVLSIGEDFTDGEQLTEGNNLGSGLVGQTADQVTCQSAFGNY